MTVETFALPVPRQAVRSRTDNPMWEIVRQIPDGSGYGTGWHPTTTGLVYDGQEWQRLADLPSRTFLCRAYSWAVPCPDALDWMDRTLDGRPVVEVGAGMGYWAWQLTQLGVDVVAYDLHPPDTHFNGYHAPLKRMWHEYTDEDRRRHKRWWNQAREMYAALEEAYKLMPEMVPPKPLPYERELIGGEWMEKPDTQWRAAPFFPVQQGGVEVAARHPERVLFLCWPPYDQDMGVNALRAYTGDSLLFIGEGDGGCTGDSELFQVLDEQWNLVDTCEAHVSWDAIHDGLTYWRRRRAICA